MLVALDHLAAAAHPFVLAIAATQAVLDFIGRAALIPMRLNSGTNLVEVGRVHAGVTLFDAIADFMLGITEQCLPAAGVVNLPNGDVAVPDTGATAGDGQRNAPRTFNDAGEHGDHAEEPAKQAHQTVQTLIAGTARHADRIQGLYGDLAWGKMRKTLDVDTPLAGWRLIVPGTAASVDGPLHRLQGHQPL